MFVWTNLASIPTGSQHVCKKSIGGTKCVCLVRDREALNLAWTAENNKKVDQIMYDSRFGKIIVVDKSLFITCWIGNANSQGGARAWKMKWFETNGIEGRTQSKYALSIQLKIIVCNGLWCFAALFVRLDLGWKQTNKQTKLEVKKQTAPPIGFFFFVFVIIKRYSRANLFCEVPS